MFVTPLALAWAALTVPIVIFYILKIRLRQVPVSTTIFWRQVFDEKRPRTLWQQLRHWLSLLVQIVWLILLVFALAEPYLPWEILQARRIVLVVDNSASMNARDVSPTRLDAAKKVAKRHISALRFRDQAAIVAAGTQPEVILGMSGHERTLLTAVDSIPKTDGPTRVPAAVELAKRLLADAKNGRVIVISDGRFEGAEQLAGDPLVQRESIGTQAGNVGITRFQARRSLLDPVGYEILAEVVNASDEPVECRLEFDLDEQPVDVLPLKLAQGQTWSQTIEKVSIDGGKLVARLNHADSLAADNEAAALLPKRQVMRVLLVSPGNLFLQKAFEANPLVELKTVKELPQKYEEGVLHVFHRLVPEKLPPGRVFVVDPATGCDAWQIEDPLEYPIVTRQDADSPLMRHVKLDNVILPQARKLKPPEEAHVLVGAVSGDPLYFALENQGRKALVLTVNLDQGDLTFRTAFPIMVTNALGWFAGESGELREALATGAVTQIDLPAGAEESFSLRSPGGKLKPLPAHVAKTSVGPLDEIGIWSVQRAGGEALPPVLELACNLGSKAESELRVPEAWHTQSSAASTAGAWFVRPIWFYLLCGALLLAIGEWVLYQRRWIS